MESRMGRLVDASANQGRDLWISPGVVQLPWLRAELLALSRVCGVSTARFHRRSAGCFCGGGCGRRLILCGFGVALPFCGRKMRLFFISRVGFVGVAAGRRCMGCPLPGC